MVVLFPGWKLMRRRTQMRRIEIMQTGSAMKNQMPQLGSGRIFCKAIMFCGEAIGEAAPPMFAARAMPRISALEKLESDGRLRRSGYKARGVREKPWLLT